MKKKLLAVSLVLVVVIVALSLRDLVREWILIPILKAVRMLESFPQDLAWFFFIGTVVFFAYSSLTNWKVRPGGTVYFRTRRQGRLEVLSDQFKKARRSEYYRERLAKTLTDLTLDILAHREQVPKAVVKERLRNGALEAPPDILAYLEAGMHWNTPVFPHKRNRWFRTKTQPSPLDLDPEKVVTFLERQLER